MKKYNFNFTAHFNIALICSVLLIMISIALFFTKGLNYGVDFRGGAEIQVKFNQTLTLENLRQALDQNGNQASSVQAIGDASENEFLLKLPASKDDINLVTQSVQNLLATKYPNMFEIRKADIVGPKAGDQLKTSAILALFWAMLAIMIYVGLRFDFKYAPGAIIALLHDVIIVVGVLIITQKEFNLQIVAALLAIIGYSVNDTVIVYDRVRENEMAHPHYKLAENINSSVNSILPRTILTSFATFIVCLIMFLMGGSVIQDFFFAMCLGIFVGTYSSIFVASSTTLFLEKFKLRK